MVNVFHVTCFAALVVISSALPPQGYANPWVPPWVATAPWMPQWVPCTTVGSTCIDCTTRLVCTKIGGLVRPCSDPLLPHCDLGACSATPSAQCGGNAAQVVEAAAIEARGVVVEEIII